MKRILFCLISASLMGENVAASITYYNTANYRSKADNPFLNETNLGILYVEDFETQNDGIRPVFELTTPNATGWNGGTLGGLSWSVQEDSPGGMGHVWTRAFSSAGSSRPPSGIHFDFTPDAQGRLPEYAGGALRGFGLLGTGPSFNVILVYDSNGVEVTQGLWQIDKLPLNPNLPIEDLFLNFEGIYVPGGISSIHFRDFTEVDHLTYGYSIPEPSAVLLATAAGLLCLRRKRKFIP